MRHREVVKLPELKKLDIVVIGHYKTDEEVFAVSARRGEKLLPFRLLWANVHLSAKVSHSPQFPLIWRILKSTL
jgi:hypothetical protein